MKLINTNRFYLEGTQNQFLHLATVHHGVQEYMCFAQRATQQIYIEEITGGSLQFIDDDSLVEGITRFLEDRKVLDMHKPLMSDDEWLRHKTNR